MSSINRTFTTQELWDYFAEYCRYETAAGGPDPHMKIPAEMARGCSWEERVWRGGCYVAVYNGAYPEVIWRAWPWERARDASQAEIEAWFKENWHRISVHVARRTARRPDWMAQYLHGYVDFVKRGFPFAVGFTVGETPEQRYDRVWDAANEVPRLGRYVAIKLLEYLRLVGCARRSALHDLRARDGYSPRAMLALLWPEQPDLAIKRNDLPLLVLAECYGAVTRTRLSMDYGLELSMFEVQVLLCQFKQAYRGKQHPGRSTDSQLGLMRRVEREWPGEPTDFWRARAVLFPPETLGEIQGWDGRRRELEKVLPHHGYTWSDLLYDYKATTNLAEPVRRAETDTVRGGA